MRVFFLVGAGVLCLTQAEAAQKPSTEESVKEAVLEAYRLAIVFEPDIELPTAELAGLMAILFGPQSLEHIDPLANNAVRWHRFGEALRILKISTLADVKQVLLGTSEDTGFLYSPSSYNRRKPLSTGAPARLEELNGWVSRTSDLKPHIHTLLSAIRSQDLELAQAVAGMARARFAEVQTDATIALEMAFILQLRDWIGEEHYLAGIRLLIETLGKVSSEDVYFLTTALGNVGLSPAEYFAFELVRRETITGQPVGLRMLAELPARVDQVGGWAEVHRWYRRDRVEKKPDPDGDTNDELSTAVQQIRAIDRRILTNPQAVEEKLRWLSIDQERLKQLLAALSPGSHLPPNVRAQVVTIAVSSITDLRRDDRRLGLLEVVSQWLSKQKPQTVEEERWIGRLNAPSTRSEHLLWWAGQLLATLGGKDVTFAIDEARTEQDPEKRIRYLIWAVQDWVVNWRRPGS